MINAGGSVINAGGWIINAGGLYLSTLAGILHKYPQAGLFSQ